ncbi:MAG TPA: PASTA domain-containing protein [Gemmatimonadales bacterium]|nr:PASTA domain-containing protein [Gemmatimonadales bacterium]
MRVRRHVPGARHDAAPPAAPAVVSGGGGSDSSWWLRAAAIVLATFGIGYVIAIAWLSPVPLFSSDHAVPRLLDLSLADAEAKLTELNFRGRLGSARPHPTIPAGRVAWQDPPAGMVLAANSIINYAASTGPAPIPVPDVIGFTRQHAERVLIAAGLRIGSVDTVAADPEPGIVIATRPAAGVGREPGGTVDLVVSGRVRLGPISVPIPALQITPPPREPGR